MGPMEGVTDGIWRTVHRSLFGGVDAWMTPFVTPSQNAVWTWRDQRFLLSHDRACFQDIPQVMTNDPKLFLWAAHSFQEMGFSEINLNCGCPSGTVTAKGRGAGMLIRHDQLRFFLDQIMTASPLPVSVKTRLGFQDAEEWHELAKIFAAYPLSRLMVHGRSRQAFYRGQCRPDLLAETLSLFSFPVLYNGGLFSPEDERFLREHLRGISGFVLARGVLTNPALGRVLRGGEPLRREEISVFHEKLLTRYMDMLPPSALLGRMREIIKYMALAFQNHQKILRKIFKAKTLTEYRTLAEDLWSLPLEERPCYHETGTDHPWP